jgi:ABC-type polysaccharide/polyol phosphate export permease
MKHLQLIRLLVGRELTLRYKRSVIGIGWTLLNPMLTSFILWVVFSYAFGNQLLDGQQYAPYLMAGIVLNNFFNQGVMMSAQSIASNTGVLTKIYVPPQIFPISVALAGLVNFFIGLIPLTVVVYVSGQTLVWTLPLVIVIGIFLALLVSGIGLALSLIFIRFDDTRNIVGVLLLIFTYVTPIFYPLSILSPRLQHLVQLNPLTSYLDCFRWAISNNAQATLFDWIYMTGSSITAILIGRFVFKRLWPRTVAML